MCIHDDSSALKCSDAKVEFQLCLLPIRQSVLDVTVT